MCVCGYLRGKGYHPEGPGQARKVGLCKPHEVQQGQVQGSAPGWSRYRLGDNWIEPCGEDLGVPVDEKLTASQQHVLTAQKAKHVLGCGQRSATSRLRAVTLPSAPFWGDCRLRSAVLPPARGPPTPEGHGPVGMRPEEAMKMIRGLEHLLKGQPGRVGIAWPRGEKAPGRL